MKRIATILSFLFHPLLMLTYGIMLALSFTYLAIYPTQLKLAIAAGTFVSTALIPGIFIWLMIKNGAATDIELSDRRERVMPFLVFITSIVVCTFFLHKMMVPFWMLALFAGTGVALIIAFCINFCWKISAHAIGTGGLLGGIMGVTRIHMINPYWAFIAMFLLAGIVGTSRIFLQKHTPMQVYAGFCLGFICTFVASIMSYFYLFI